MERILFAVMPIRMLRDWTDSTTMENVSAEGERLFTRLIMKADDFGRFHGDPRLVRALCFPLNDGIKTDTVRKWMEELNKAGLIFTYQAEERDFLAIVNFGQRLKQSRAKFPQLPGEVADWKPTSGNFRELPGTSGLNRREENTEVNGKKKPPQLSDEEWIASLAADPAFSHIDIKAELQRAQKWIHKQNGRRVFTRRFFEGWLERAEKPVAINGHDARKPSEKY